MAPTKNLLCTNPVPGFLLLGEKKSDPVNEMDLSTLEQIRRKKYIYITATVNYIGLPRKP